MIKPRLILCSGATVPEDDPLREGRTVITLDSLGAAANVRIQIEDVARVLLTDLSPRLVDLLEIAAYVFCADAGTRRGTQWTDDATTEAWDRDFRFVIPVRDLSFWCREDVQHLLVQILHFLSDDNYGFDFRQLSHDRPQQHYLDLGNDWDDWPFHSVDRVIMFSGGLDSLAGAAQTARRGDNLVLVSHRPVATLGKRQQLLFKSLQATYPVQMIHVPVWINKEMNLGREPTQRTRSFLFAALGALVGYSVRANGVRFFENGIVSLNLPIADEVQRARASRTTHPWVLRLLTQFLCLATDREFVVDNPFVTMTKAEVVTAVVDSGAGQLLGKTVSCAHTMFQPKGQPHCGTCSQCIDRRVAILAAGQADKDSETDYASDVFTGPRREGYERNIAVGYARHAFELQRMGDLEVAAKFNRDLTRAVRGEARGGEVARQYVEMHKRHSKAVAAVIEQQLGRHAAKLFSGELDKTSMLALIAGGEHLETSWKRYADRIAEMLSAGLPRACKTHKPQNETHLQEICDGILHGQESDLVREFPLMRWSSSFTKPDWSVEVLRLWVEMKYIRKSADIRPITEAIAADLSKYGDNERRTLYVVYDPPHLIIDEKQFAAPIHKRTDMRVRFIR